MLVILELVEHSQTSETKVKFSSVSLWSWFIPRSGRTPNWINMSKIYLYNPERGSPIKNWYDGTSYWKLAVGDTAAFPQEVGRRLKQTYGFLQELSAEEFEVQLAKLAKAEPARIKVSPEGQLVPKSEEELAEEKKQFEVKKEEIKSLKEKMAKAPEAKPDEPAYWELSRGALINELDKRGVEIKGLNKKGVYVTKEQLISLLENDDNK